MTSIFVHNVYIYIKPVFLEWHSRGLSCGFEKHCLQYTIKSRPSRDWVLFRPQHIVVFNCRYHVAFFGVFNSSVQVMVLDRVAHFHALMIYSSHGAIQCVQTQTRRWLKSRLNETSRLPKPISHFCAYLWYTNQDLSSNWAQTMSIAICNDLVSVHFQTINVCFN